MSTFCQLSYHRKCQRRGVSRWSKKAKILSMQFVKKPQPYVQLAAFNRICPESLSIASIPYAQKHSHIAWQKVGLYQEGEEQKPRENAWSPLLLLEQPFSFLKISSKYNSTRELDLSSEAKPSQLQAVLPCSWLVHNVFPAPSQIAMRSEWRLLVICGAKRRQVIVKGASCMHSFGFFPST